MSKYHARYILETIDQMLQNPFLQFAYNVKKETASKLYYWHAKKNFGVSDPSLLFSKSGRPKISAERQI